MSWHSRSPAWAGNARAIAAHAPASFHRNIVMAEHPLLPHAGSYKCHAAQRHIKRQDWMRAMAAGTAVTIAALAFASLAIAACRLRQGHRPRPRLEREVEHHHRARPATTISSPPLRPSPARAACASIPSALPSMSAAATTTRSRSTTSRHLGSSSAIAAFPTLRPSLSIPTVAALSFQRRRFRGERARPRDGRGRRAL